MGVIKSLRFLVAVRCDEASQLASEACERKLTRIERCALRFHLLVCHPCRRFVQQITSIRQLVRDMPLRWRGETSAAAVARLSPERRRRIIRLLADAQHFESN